jgi:hypothetical protein
MANETRLTGIANVGGGILLAVFVLTHPMAGEFATAPIVLSSPWALVHTAGLLSAILSVFGTIGIYRAFTRHDTLALFAFALATTGILFEGAGAIIDGYFVPPLAATDPTLISATGPLLSFPQVMAFALPKFLLFLPGFVLLGVSMLVNPSVPKLLAWLFIVGVVLLSAAVAPWPVIILGGLLFGAAQIWTGFLLLRPAS